MRGARLEWLPLDPIGDLTEECVPHRLFGPISSLIGSLYSTLRLLVKDQLHLPTQPLQTYSQFWRQNLFCRPTASHPQIAHSRPLGRVKYISCI